MSDKGPVYILPENASRTMGREAQRNNILAAKIIADIVKTTLGPRGMDKMIVDSAGNVIVTNDGVTILQEMEIDHPAAKMVVEISKTQEAEVGDGTTTVAMLAGKLLENAEKLLDRKIHPTVIVKGYRLAAEKAQTILNEISVPLNGKELLRQIAATAMTGKGAEGSREKLADLIVEAVNQVAVGTNIDINHIKIEKITGETIGESELVQGIVLAKEIVNQDMPRRIENARIALIDFALELKNPETETKISVSSPDQLASFVEAEERILKTMTQKIINSGANVVFCQKGIDDVAQYYLAKFGIIALRRVIKSDLEKLSRATGAKIVSNINELSEDQLGKAKIVEEVRKGEDGMTFVRGCENPKSVTLLVKGTTSHVVDEIERAVKDGMGDVIAAVKSGKILAGGGAVEIELSRRLRQFSKTLGGREQLAVEEFAQALESIPEALAENAGLDPIEIITELKKRHESGKANEGINLFTNTIEDCVAAGIVEPMKVKTQAVNSASEVATLILRIDDVLVAGPKETQKQDRYSGLD